MSNLETQIEQALKQSAFSMSEVASRSGVSRNTLYSWIKGSNQPRLNVLEEVLLSAGIRIRLEFGPLSAPAAATAARVKLGELAPVANQEVADWIERFDRWGDSEESEIIARASWGSNPLVRQGAVHFMGAQEVRIASAADSLGNRWALSQGEHSSIVWCENAESVLPLLPERVRRSTSPVVGGVTLLEASGTELIGMKEVENLFRVSELQQRIDWGLNV